MTQNACIGNRFKYSRELVSHAMSGRTTISIDEDVLEQARERGINVSNTTERALIDALSGPQYHFVNTNKQGLPDGMDGTGCYENGVTATYGSREYGEKLANIDRWDIIISWVKNVGVRAIGRALAEWDGRSVDENDPQRIAPSREGEYHVPTRWDAVLPERDAITASEFRRLTDRNNIPRQTRVMLQNEHNPAAIVDMVIGRAGRR